MRCDLQLWMQFNFPFLSAGTFQNIEHVFLVGVAGGVPQFADYYRHPRLGDIVFSKCDRKGNLYYHCDKIIQASGNLYYRCDQIIQASDNLCYRCGKIILSSGNPYYRCDNIIQTGYSLCFRCDNILQASFSLY